MVFSVFVNGNPPGLKSFAASNHFHGFFDKPARNDFLLKLLNQKVVIHIRSPEVFAREQIIKGATPVLFYISIDD